MESTSQTESNTPVVKKGLGTGAKIGIGCGALVALILVGLVIFGLVMAPKMKKFAEDAQQNPTRAAASMMVTVSGGKMTMVAEDDSNKRYTVKESGTGVLTTIYWDEVKKEPVVITGDFSAIPPPSVPAAP